MNLILKHVDGVPYLTAKEPIILKLIDGKTGTLGGCHLLSIGLCVDILIGFEYKGDLGSIVTSHFRTHPKHDIYLDLSDPVTKEFHDLAVKMLTPKVELGITLNNFMEIFSEFAKNGVNDKEKIPDFLDSLGYRLKQGE